MSIPISFTVDDIKYHSVREFLERNNFHAHTFNKALKLFSDDIEYKHAKAAHYLLNKKIAEPEKEIILVWGYKFNSLKEVSVFFNVSINSLQKRIHDLNLNAEEAIQLLLGQSKEEWKQNKKLKTYKVIYFQKDFVVCLKSYLCNVA